MNAVFGECREETECTVYCVHVRNTNPSFPITVTDRGSYIDRGESSEDNI